MILWGIAALYVVAAFEAGYVKEAPLWVVVNLALAVTNATLAVIFMGSK
jgi:hypothetical protein